MKSTELTLAAAVCAFLLLGFDNLSAQSGAGSSGGKIKPPADIPGNTVVDHTNFSLEGVADPQILQVKKLKIYFEHASVGSNILEGLEALGKVDSRYVWDLLNRTSVNSDIKGDSIPASWFSQPGRFGDLSRGYPASGQLGPLEKLEFFKSSLTGGLGNVVDVAMFKFCYLDGSGDGTVLFEKVKGTMEALESAYPQVAFVWWTMPHQNWPNLNIHSYNELVRAYCRDSGRWLLDLSDLETRDDQGNQFIDQEHLKWNPDERIPLINPDYTSDGGHLNAKGAAKVARAWWKLLSLIAESRS